MARYSPRLPTDYELPALLSVSGILIAITLAKGGYALWAIGGMLFLYVLYLAAQRARPGAGSPSVRWVTAADPMIKAGTSITCAAAAATMVAASAVMLGRMDSDPDQLIKVQTKSVDRATGISLRQIEYCLEKDQTNDQTALNRTLAELDSKCPIDRREI